MSNPTPKTPEVTPSVVVPDAPRITAEDLKAPSKVKTALLHPIKTIKRHSVVSTALIAGAVGAAGALFLTKDSPVTDSDENDDIPEYALKAVDDIRNDNTI